MEIIYIITLLILIAVMYALFDLKIRKLTHRVDRLNCDIHRLFKSITHRNTNFSFKVWDRVRMSHVTIEEYIESVEEQLRMTQEELGIRISNKPEHRELTRDAKKK